MYDDFNNILLIQSPIDKCKIQPFVRVWLKCFQKVNRNFYVYLVLKNKEFDADLKSTENFSLGQKEKKTKKEIQVLTERTLAK